MECIWCKKENSSSDIEHIIPESFGCPPGFVLSEGAVCKSCNNGLAHLDQAVSDEFDVIAFWSDVPRKRGRLPEIRSRGNVVGTSGPGGKTFTFNMERFPVKAHDGTSLGAFGKSERNIQAAFERDGDLDKVSFSVPIGQGRKFIRGIVKIAFSSFAYFLGADNALAEDFDPIRRFVRRGKGSRSILLIPSQDTSYRNEAKPPFQSENGTYAVTFRLAAVEFCVDLSPDMTLFPMFKKKAVELYGNSGWAYLPINT